MIGKEFRNVIHNAGYLLITQAAMYISPLLILSYLLKVLGVQVFGNYAIILAVVAYLQIITDYGFSFSSSRAISQNRSDKTLIASIYCATTIIKTAISISLFIILYGILAILPLDANLRMGILFGYLIVIGNTFQPQWYFQGIERLKIVALFNVFSKVLACGLVFVFVKDKNDLLKTILVLSLPAILSALILNLIIIFNFRFKIVLPSKGLILSILKDGKDFFLASLYSVALNNSGVFILGVIASPAVVGTYAAAEKIVKAILSLFSPLTQAIYPYNCNKFSNSLTEGIQTAKRTGLPLILLAMLASFTLIITIPFVTEILNLPVETVFISRVLGLWLFFGVTNNVFGIQILSASGNSQVYSKLVLVSAILTLLLMAVLSYFYSANGVAFSILFGEVALLIMLAHEVKKIFVNL